MTALGPTPVDVETLTYEQLAKTIDHSLLKPELRLDEVEAGCELARSYGVASACVRPADVGLAARLLARSDVFPCAVVAFPHGSSTTEAKVLEARRAIADGAEELDVVLNIGRLRSGLDAEVTADIAAVVEAAEGRVVKVILENAYLSDDQKVRGSRAAEQAGAGFVKTSTGFAPSGATLEDVRLMRDSISDTVQVKAAGGVRTLDALLEMLRAGVTRVGATATKAILDEFRERAGGPGATA